MDPTPATPNADHADDQRLRRALLDLPPDEEARLRLAAINARVVSQWHALQKAAPAGVAGGGRPWLVFMGRGGRASWAAGAAGLAVGLALVLHSWLGVPDPALEELLQPDVLSQMAAGEM